MPGLIVGGVFAAVLVVAAAVIAGFFVGRETAPASNGSSAGSTDAALATGTASSVEAAIVAGDGSALAVTAPLLLAHASGADGSGGTAEERADAAAEREDVEGMLFDAVGAAVVQLRDPVVEVEQSPDGEETKVVIRGATQLHGVDADAVVVVYYVRGKLRLAVEHYPQHGNWSLADLAGESPTAGGVVPNISSSNAVFVAANFEGRHPLHGSPGQHAPVARGLNLVTTMTADGNPAMETLLASTGTATSGGAGRRLSHTSLPPAAHVITTQVSKWYDGMHVPVSGSVRPHLNLTASVPSLKFHDHLELHNVTLHTAAGRSAAMSFSAIANINLPGSPPAAVAVTGSMKNGTYKLRGTLDALTLGPAGTGITVRQVTLTAKGSRGPAIPDVAISYKTTLSGSLALAGVQAAFNVTLPLSAGVTTINVSDIHVDSNVVLRDVALHLGPDFCSATARLSVVTHLADAQPLEAAATIAFGDGNFTVEADMEDWTLPTAVAGGIKLTSLHAKLTGPSSLLRASPVDDTQYSLHIAGQSRLHDTLLVDATLDLPAHAVPVDLQPTTTLASTATAAAAAAAAGNATRFWGTLVDEGVTFQLTVAAGSAPMTARSALDATVGADGTAAQLEGQPVAASTLSHMHDVAFERATLAITTSPLTFMARGELDVFGVDDVAVELVAQRPSASSGWLFGVGAALSSPFKFSDVVPDDTGFDHIPFSSGIVAISTGNATFTMSTGGASPASLTTGAKGIALTADIPMRTFSARLVDDGTWSDAGPVTVSASFGASTHDLVFDAALPPNLPLTKDVTMRAATVHLASSQPLFALQAEAEVAYSSTHPPLACSITGDISSTTAFSLDAAVHDWRIGAEAHGGVDVLSASVKLNGTKRVPDDAPGGNATWAVTGEVTGDVRFGGAGGMRVEAVIDLPVSKDHVEVEVPEVRINDDVRLTNITVSRDGNVYALSGAATITFSAMEPLTVSVSATLAGRNMSVTGRVPQWAIGGDRGVVCRDIDLTLSGQDVAGGGLRGVSGKLSGRADFFGQDVPFDVQLPMRKQGDMELSISHVDFGHNVELKSVNLTVRRAGIEKKEETEYVLAADASVGTGVKADRLGIRVDGTLLPAVGNLSLHGELERWDISSDFEIEQLRVDLHLSRNASSSGTAASGVLTGELAFDDVRVDVKAALPAESLTVSFPVLKLSHDVEVKDVSMTVTGGTPSFSFSGTVQVATGQDPLDMVATGTIHGRNFTMDATVASWRVRVGHEDFTVTAAALHMEAALGDAAKTFRGTLTGELSFDHATDMVVRAAVPAPPPAAAHASHELVTGGLELELTLAAGHRVTVGSAVAATCGSTALASAKAPSGTVGGVQDKDVVGVKLFMITHPPMFNMSAGVRDAFGLGLDLDLQLVATQRKDSWRFALAVAIGTGFSFSKVAPGNDGFDHLPFAGGAVAIANYDGHRFFEDHPSGAPSLEAVDGVAFVATLPVSHLKQHLEAAGRWGDDADDVRINGTFLAESHDLTLEGELPPNLPLGSTAKLNATVLLQQTEPKYSLNASAAITMHNDVDELIADVEVTYDGAEWHVNGTAPIYSFHIGEADLHGHSIIVRMSDGGEDHFRGTIQGLLGFRHPDVDLKFNFTVPAEDNGHGGMSFELELIPGDTISFHNLIKTAMPSADTVTMPHEFGSVMQTRLQTASVTLSTKPPSINARGTMSLFRFRHPLIVQLGIQSSHTGHWSYGVGIGIGQSFDIGRVIASQAHGKANEYSFGSGGVVITNAKEGWTFDMGPGTPALTMHDGIAIQGVMDMKQGKLSTVNKWSGRDELVMIASFAFDDHDFRLQADVDKDWKIGSHVWVTKAVLFMDIGGRNGFDMGVGCDLAARVGHSHPQTLKFKSDLEFTDKDVQFEAEMETPWVDPFGHRGVTVGRTEILLGISYFGYPDAFGFSGSLTIGSVSGGATVYVDPGSPVEAVLACHINKFNLGVMLEHLTHGVMPSFLAKTIYDVGFTDLAMSLNAGTQALVFDGKTFNPGFRFSVGKFDLWGITGAVDLQIGSRSFFLNATVNPIKVGHDGDILTVSGYHCDDCPAQMLIELGAGHMPGRVHISGQAQLLKIVDLECQIDISDEGVKVEIEFLSPLLDVIFKLNSPGRGHPKDFSLYAEVEQKLLDYIGTQVVGFLKKAKEDADKKLDDAKKKVQDWEDSQKPLMARNSAEIKRLKEEQEEKAEEPERKLREAKSALNHAQQKVNGLQGEIDNDEHDKEHCHHWWDFGCDAHNAWLDIKIGALWIAEHVADAALDIAKIGIDVAEVAVRDAEQVIANLNPRVLELEVENAAIEVAYHVAEAALGAAEGVTNAVLDGLEFVAEAIADIFNIEKLWFSASSTSDIRDHGQVDIGMQGIIVGEHFKWELKIEWPPNVDHMLDTIWDEVKKHIKL